MDLFYLVENIDGFERPISMGTEEELAVEEKKLRSEKVPLPPADDKPGWVRAGYYRVPKKEWDSEHCPLIPVDFS